MTGSNDRSLLYTYMMRPSAAIGPYQSGRMDLHDDGQQWPHKGRHWHKHPRAQARQGFGMADLDRVWGSAFKVWGLGLGSGSRVQGLGFGASCFGADLWQSWRSRSTGEEDRAKTCPCRVGGWGAAAAAVCDEDGRKLLELSRNFSQDPDLLWPAAAASPARCCGGAGGGGGGAGW